MPKPVLMLDVDGVIIPFWDRPDPSLPEYASRLIRVCKLMWASANEEAANRRPLTLLGLEDPLSYIEFKGAALVPGIQTWKLPWIMEWEAANEDRPLVWMDDELWDDAVGWAAARTEAGTPTLMIPTDPTIGMTADHVDKIEDWAKEAAA